jgi:HSP20 family protein
MTLTITPRKAPSDSDLGRIRDEMERAIETMLTEPLLEPRLFRVQGWMPVVDVSETDSEMVIRAEVPGMADEDVELAVVGNAIVLSGEKRSEEESSGEDWRRCERRFGAFRRVIELPQSVDAEEASAESENGVITVRVPKCPGTQPKHIEIKPAGAGGPKR